MSAESWEEKEPEKKAEPEEKPEGGAGRRRIAWTRRLPFRSQEVRSGN